jgi:hypothetical protein
MTTVEDHHVQELTTSMYRQMETGSRRSSEHASKSIESVRCNPELISSKPSSVELSGLFADDLVGDWRV